MRKLAAILGILVIALVAILSISALNPSAQVNAELSEPFTLKIGQSAVLQSENIRVTVWNVTEDSRCPTGVECIWAGQVGGLVHIEKEGRNLGDFNLISNQEKSTAIFDGYKIELVEVEPYPIYGKKLEVKDYLVRLIIYRN